MRKLENIFFLTIITKQHFPIVRLLFSFCVILLECIIIGRYILYTEPYCCGTRVRIPQQQFIQIHYFIVFTTAVPMHF